MELVTGAGSSILYRQRFATFTIGILACLTLLTGYWFFPLFYVIGLLGGGLAILACGPPAAVSGLQNYAAVSSVGFPGHCTHSSDESELDRELESFKSLIVRDYVASWYGLFAGPADYFEVKVVIDSCIDTLVSYMLRLDTARLLSVVTERFHTHYSSCIDATRAVQSRAEKSVRDEPTRNLHVALAHPPETEVRYNKGIAAALLLEALPKHHHGNVVLIELLTEVLSVHVITRIVGMFSKKGFAHEVLWKCLSDTGRLEQCEHALFQASDVQSAADVSHAEDVGCNNGGSNPSSSCEAIGRTRADDAAQPEVPTSQRILLATAQGYCQVNTSGARDEYDEPESPEEFVSEDLAKYFKVAPELTNNPGSQDNLARYTKSSSDVGNVVVSAQSMDHSALKTATISSHELFTNVLVTNVQIMDDNCSVLYTIMYKAWYHRSDGSASALKSKTIKKMHQDLVILHHTLLGNAGMTEIMKAVGTPSCLEDGYKLTTPESNVMHELKEAVTEYLQLLTAHGVLCNSNELKQFLEYDSGDFVMLIKPADVGIPRLNQVLAKTWSGVWDKMTRLGFESRPRIEKQAEEVDKVFDEFKLSVALDETMGAEGEDYKLLSALMQHSEEAAGVDSPRSVQLLPADDSISRSYSRSTAELKGLSAASGLHKGSHSHAPASAVLELGLLCLHHCNPSSWMLNDRVAAFVKNILAFWLQKHLHELLQYHLSTPRLAHYVRLLADSLSASSAAVAAVAPSQGATAAAVNSEQLGRGPSASASEGCKHYDKALSALRSAFPGFLPAVLGAATFDRCLKSFLDSFDDELQNKNLIYTVMDDVVGELLALGSAAAVNAVDVRS